MASFCSFARALHGKPQATGRRGSHAHQAFVTHSDIVLRGHRDKTLHCGSVGYQSLQWSLPGEKVSEEAAVSKEEEVLLGDCGQC
ncbi:hypothetical protein Nmel_001677 [Mimus melanotis]